MMIKLDDFYLGVLINGLNTHRHSYDNEINFSKLLLRLINEHEQIKPNHKVKLDFTSDEIRTVRTCLLDWRNDALQGEKEVAVEVISETLAKFL